MRICFIATQSGGYDGSEVLWYMMAREALLSKNTDVLISVDSSYLSHVQLSELIELGAQIHVRHFINPFTILEKVMFKLRCHISKFNTFYDINKFEPDLIVVSQRGTYDAASQLMLSSFLINSNLSYVLISQFHKEGKAEIKQIVKNRAIKLFPRARKFYFVSARNKLACEATIGKELKNAYIINNPIKLAVENIGWPKEANYCIACVARINFKVKRQHLIVNLLGKEKWNKRNIKLNFYGDGPDSLELMKLIELRGLKSKVKFHGQVSDINRIWRENHLMILPSVAEGLPLALIEANLFGRAAITTKVGDNERLVKHGETGFLIENFSEEALDIALEEAWSKRNLWSSYGKKAREHACLSLDLEIHKTLLTQIFNFIDEQAATS